MLLIEYYCNIYGIIDFPKKKISDKNGLRQ